MIRSVVFDIETTGLLDHLSIDYSKMPYKIKSTYKTHCIVAKDIENDKVDVFINDGKINTICDFLKYIRQFNIIIGHNIINFDLLSLRLTHGLDYSVNQNIHKRLNMSDKLEVMPDRLFGKHVKFIDTLVLSKLLNPDRFGGHSLKSWGERLEYSKGDFAKSGEGDQDVWAEYSEAMLTYCVRDVNLNYRVYDALLSEMQPDPTIWSEAFQLESAIVDLITRSSHFGFKYNIDLAKKHVEDLNMKLGKLEREVHPLLPKRQLPKGKQLRVPANPWKKAFDYNEPFTKSNKLKKVTTTYLDKIGIPTEEQEDYIRGMFTRSEIEGNVFFESNIEKLIPKHPSILTQASIGFCAKFGVTDVESCCREISAIVSGDKPIPVLTEPMELSHKDDVKQYIISLGWAPTKWAERDLFLNAKKKKRNNDEIAKAIVKYCDNTVGSQYERFRCDFLKCSVDTLEDTLKSKVTEGNRLIVISSPQYTADKEKNICKNLLKMKDKVPFINKIVEWLTYSHRKNSILSDKGTGFLSHERLKVDGHIPTPADTLGAVTGRFTHKNVANLPRVSTIFGKEIRSEFGVDKDHYLLTADADGLENRYEGHFCYKYDGGPEYADKLEAAKPFDWHTVFSKKLGIDRDDGKSVKYGLSYGQQPRGLAKNMGWKLKKAKDVYNGFWEEAAPLKKLRDRLEKHWEGNGRKYIVGIDGRRLHARAKHLLLNLLFQSSGVCGMKRQHIILDRLLKEAGLLGDPFTQDLRVEPKATLIIAYHDEESQAVHRDLIRFKSFDSKEEAEACKSDLESKGFILSDINHGIPEICEGKYFIAHSKVIDITSKSMVMAGEYYNMNIKLTQAGQLGLNWSQTH